jgi:hypothetical protein
MIKGMDERAAASGPVVSADNRETREDYKTRVWVD